MDFKIQSCYVDMHFGKLRNISLKLKKHNINNLLENVGCIPLAVVIMTTANEMHPSFSGRHTKY